MQLWANRTSCECSSLVMTHANAAFAVWKQKISHLSALFNAVVSKRIWLWILIMTNRYSWPNWDQKCTHTQMQMHIPKLCTCFSQANFGRSFLSCTVHVHVEIHIVLLLIIKNGMAFSVNALMVTKKVHCVHNEWWRYMLVVNFNTQRQIKWDWWG